MTDETVTGPQGEVTGGAPPAIPNEEILQNIAAFFGDNIVRAYALVALTDGASASYGNVPHNLTAAVLGQLEITKASLIDELKRNLIRTTQNPLGAPANDTNPA